MSNESNSSVKLLGAWPSPVVMRSRIALNLKNVEYEFIEETMFPKSELLLKSNPVHKKIPVLFHNDKPVCESNIIVQYIDEAFSGGVGILPCDAYVRALHRFWASYVDDKIFPSMIAVRKATTEEEKTSATDQVKAVITLLEEAFTNLSNGNSYFGGENIGYLDIAFGSLLGWLRVMEKLNKIALLDEANAPKLSVWALQFCAHDSVKDVMPETGKLAEFAKFMMAKQMKEAAAANGST